MASDHTEDIDRLLAAVQDGRRSVGSREIYLDGGGFRADVVVSPHPDGPLVEWDAVAALVSAVRALRADLTDARRLLSALQDTVALCDEHQPDRYAGVGTCIVCEVAQLHTEAGEADAEVAALREDRQTVRAVLNADLKTASDRVLTLELEIAALRAQLQQVTDAVVAFRFYVQDADCCYGGSCQLDECANRLTALRAKLLPAGESLDNTHSPCYSKGK